MYLLYFLYNVRSHPSATSKNLGPYLLTIIKNILHLILQNSPNLASNKANPFCIHYRRPLLHAWLLPDLSTIPNNCIRDDLFCPVVVVLAFGA